METMSETNYMTQDEREEACVEDFLAVIEQKKAEKRAVYEQRRLENKSRIINWLSRNVPLFWKCCEKEADNLRCTYAVCEGGTNYRETGIIINGIMFALSEDSAQLTVGLYCKDKPMRRMGVLVTNVSTQSLDIHLASILNRIKMDIETKTTDT